MSARTILIVEDDQVIRESLMDFLIGEGFDVKAAKNGQEGLSLIHELNGRCIVLLDLQMPVFTGEQLLDALGNDPNLQVTKVPVLVMTAGAEPLRKPVDGFVRKPIDLNLLLSELQRLSADSLA